MAFRPLNDVKNRVVSHEAYISAAASPTNQRVASVTVLAGNPASHATAFERGVTFALIKLEASEPVELEVPSIGDPVTWTSRLALASFDSDHAPLMFTDGIRIKVTAGAIDDVTLNAYIVAVR